MFALVRWCVEPITQWCSGSRSQLKVIRLFLVRSISPESFERFSWNFGQMFALVRWCAEPITQACRLKVKVTVQGREFEPWILCPLYISIPLEGFSYNFGQMFASVKWCAEPIAQPCRLRRSQFKVTGLSLEFCVHSVSPLPQGGFSLNFGRMFTSVGQCAEPITQPCGLEVKVTVEGLEFEPWIWCRLHISFTPGRIFFKPWSNVCLSEMICRTHLSYAD